MFELSILPLVPAVRRLASESRPCAHLDPKAPSAVKVGILDLSAFRFASTAILTLAGGGRGSGGTPLKRGCSTAHQRGRPRRPLRPVSPRRSVSASVFRSVSPVDFGSAGCCFLGGGLCYRDHSEVRNFRLAVRKVIVVAFSVFEPHALALAVCLHLTFLPPP